MWANPYYFAQFGSAQAFQVLANMVINTVVLPVIALLLLQRMKLLDNLQLTERKQRAIPFLVLIFFFFWTFVVFLKEPALPRAFTGVAFGAFLSLFAAYMINVLVFKVSLHTIGVGAFVAVLFYASALSLKPLWPFLMITFLAGGLIGSARLILSAHTAREVYAGFFVGFFAQIFAFLLLG